MDNVSKCVVAILIVLAVLAGVAYMRMEKNKVVEHSITESSNATEHKTEEVKKTETPEATTVETTKEVKTVQDTVG